ncbi:DUF1361 domain-containing protein [Staphylococcus canis]|uniref:DUF1361 domain-containing protein n=1 Tax=Staphylococcus canis TaxID=2724942 RepID=A0ABS0T5J0_9STAP|nr:DUF1361 domain-containing protein [Staphylococcus canis]
MKARNIARIMYIVLMSIIFLLPNYYRFTLLNMTLAYIPLELAFLLKLFIPRRSFEWPFFIIYICVFILMLPNTFYMLTDLIHLNQFQFAFLSGIVLYEWVHFTLLLLAVMFAMFCYILIIIELNRLPFSKWIRLSIIISVLFLNSLGIYIGRFLRFHTVHVINHPFSVLISTVQAIDGKALLFILMLTLLQVFLLCCVKGVRMKQ